MCGNRVYLVTKRAVLFNYREWNPFEALIYFQLMRSVFHPPWFGWRREWPLLATNILATALLFLSRPNCHQSKCHALPFLVSLSCFAAGHKLTNQNTTDQILFNNCLCMLRHFCILSNLQSSRSVSRRRRLLHKSASRLESDSRVSRVIIIAWPQTDQSLPGGTFCSGQPAGYSYLSGLMRRRWSGPHSHGLAGGRSAETKVRARRWLLGKCTRSRASERNERAGHGFRH